MIFIVWEYILLIDSAISFKIIFENILLMLLIYMLNKILLTLTYLNNNFIFFYLFITRTNSQEVDVFINKMDKKQIQPIAF